MEHKKQPQIRFKGFSDAWKECKLDDFGKSTGGISIESEFSDDGKYKVISIGSYSETSTYHDQGIRCKLSDRTKDRVLNKGDITMILNDKTSSGNIIGRALLVDKSESYVYNQRTERIEIDKKEYDPLFIYELLNAPNIRKKIIKESQGNTQIYVNWTRIKELIYYTPNLKEQRKLGIYFNNIDNIITLYQYKLEKLKKLKKSLLEKMFAKTSEKVPKIRFKGFTDIWKQRKFERIFDYERPDKYIVSYDEYNKIGKTPVLTANKTFILGYTNENNTYHKEKESIIFDDFTLDTKFVDFPYMVKSSAIKILTLKSKSTDNLRFNYELLNNTKFNVLGHARHYISVVQSEEVLTTKKTEQDKIADLFSNLDNLINLYQTKLKKLKKFKKSLLNKMFI